MLTEYRTRVLVIEEDALLGKQASQVLTKRGFQCDQVNGLTPQTEVDLQNQQYDLVIQGFTERPESENVNLLKQIISLSEELPVLMLIPLRSGKERDEGLRAGATDFVIKPFSMDELLARCEAALVRSRSVLPALIRVGELQMDLTRRQLTKGSKVISLTPTEFRMLEILGRHRGQVVSRQMLCEHLWNPDWEGVTNVIEVHINRLRTKLKKANEPNLIHTVRGKGYLLKAADSSSSMKPTAWQGFGGT